MIRYLGSLLITLAIAATISPRANAQPVQRDRPQSATPAIGSISPARFDATDEPSRQVIMSDSEAREMPRRTQVTIFVEMGFSAAYSLPNIEPLGSGLGGGAGVQISPRFVAVAHLAYGWFVVDRSVLAGNNQDIWDTAVTVLSHKSHSLMSIAPEVRYRINDNPGKSSLYLCGGPSYTQLVEGETTIRSVKGTRTLPERTRSSLGFTVGAGYEMPVRIFKLFGEIRYSGGFVDEGYASHFTSISVGGALGF
jgi:hypothetical protein